MATFELGLKLNPNDKRDIRYRISYDADWDEEPANDYHFYVYKSKRGFDRGEQVFEEEGKIEGWGWSYLSYFKVDPGSYVAVAQFTLDGEVIGEVQNLFSNN